MLNLDFYNLTTTKKKNSQVLQVELNCFYLKYLLWFAPEEPLNTVRLILHFFFGVVGIRECYQYVTDKYVATVT